MQVAQRLARVLAIMLALRVSVLAMPQKGVEGGEKKKCPTGDNSDVQKRGATYFDIKQWPDARVPYILTDLPGPLSRSIRGAMREWETGSCVRFVPKVDGDKRWVNFKKGDDGCWSEGTGPRSDGEMIVNLDMPNVWEEIWTFGAYSSCNEAGTPAHELGHLLGLIHEHQRPDRDKFLKIEWNRIHSDNKPQFEIYPCASTAIPFDYNSVMMYDDRAWSDDCGALQWMFGDTQCKHTMTSLTDAKISPDEHPTANDYASVNLAYECPPWLSKPVPARRDVHEAPAERWEISTYDFLLDPLTEKWMTDNGFDTIAIHQHCDGSGIGHDSNNWAYMPRKGSGEENHYFLEVPRCRKDWARRPASYEVALCKGAEEGLCEEKCGLRGLRPINPTTMKETFPKAVTVVDDVAWVCHRH